MNIIATLTKQFGLQNWQVENTVKLIDEGNTIPFIARYRKEAHGTLDDQVLRELSERLEYLRNLDKRRAEITVSIESQEAMTPEIAQSIEKAITLAELEDIYRPFKPKRRTRASIAKEKGLEPLAIEILNQEPKSKAPIELALEYINEEKEVGTVEEALSGACDIIAEQISDNADIRRRLRNLFCAVGLLQSKSQKEEDSVYALYYDFSQKVDKLAGHQILAIDRGEKEGFLKVAVTLERPKAMGVIESIMVMENGSPCTETVKLAGEDAYDRLIFPSVEREIRAMLTEKAATSAIKVFAANLRPLLLCPPVKNKVTMGLDPGYRTGCKVAVVDETGKVLDTGVIYVTHSEAQRIQAQQEIAKLIKKYSVQAIA
ncbi:MAG: Tex-like N-terminal domain-containing protein, partial [Oscillospiraceae bacterium]